MKRRRSNSILLLTLVLLIGVLLPMGVACEPEIPLQIENRTDMTLTIYVEGVNDGQVEPHKTIKIKDVGAISSQVLIEAKNSKGETVYYRKLGINELYDADWKVVITPLED